MSMTGDDLVRFIEIDDDTWLPPQKTVDALRAVIVSAGSGVQFDQTLAAAQWSFTHTFGRLPAVVVRDSNGNQLIADVAVTTTTVIVTHATPRTGSITLT